MFVDGSRDPKIEAKKRQGLLHNPGPMTISVFPFNKPIESMAPWTNSLTEIRVSIDSLRRNPLTLMVFKGNPAL